MKSLDDLGEDIRPLALTEREYTLISRLNQISTWLGKNTRTQTIDLVKAEYNVGLPEAEKWVAKAEDFLLTGMSDGVDHAKTMYLLRMTDIYQTLRAHAIEDETEVTVKPTRVRKKGDPSKKGTPEGEDRSEIVNVTRTKIRRRVLNVSALRLAFQVAREIGIVQGARPRDMKVNVNNYQLNLTNMPGSADLHRQGNADLARLAGVELVEQPVLPQRGEDDQGGSGVAASEAERSAQTPGPADDHHPGEGRPADSGDGQQG